MTRRAWMLLAALLALAAPAGAQGTDKTLIGNEIYLGTEGVCVKWGEGSPENEVDCAPGSIYMQVDGAAGLTCWEKEGGSGWDTTGWVTCGGGGGGGGAHNLLSATHSDASPAAAVRGAAIVGDSGPDWSRVNPSATGQALIYDGLDTAFSLDATSLNVNASNLSTGTVPAARMPALTGDVTTSAGAVATTIAADAVTTGKILDGTILFGDWAVNGCTAGQVPKVNAGATTWECHTLAAGGGNHALLSTVHTDTNAASGVQGDLITADASGLWTRKAIGAVGQLLTVVGGVPTWGGHRRDTEPSASACSTSVTIDWDAGNQQVIEMTGDCAITLQDGQPGGPYRLFLVQDGTGGRTPSWVTSVIWENGAAPTIDETADTFAFCQFLYTAEVGAGGYVGFCTTEPLAVP